MPSPSIIKLFFPLLLAWGLSADASPAPVREVRVLAQYPHDTDFFTQGLFFHQHRLYESSGLYGRSRLAHKDPESALSLREQPIDGAFFAEGAAAVGDTIYLLTLRNQTMLAFDVNTLAEKTGFSYPGQGWGLASDGERLIRSDGSDMLYFHDLRGKITKTLEVREGERPIFNLNELEWADGLILANIWRSTRIAAIDPQSGQVVFWLELAPLLPGGLSDANEMVANGIAFDPDGRKLWVTGKHWPVIYVLSWPPCPLPADGESNPAGDR
jgi:glutaminyl-peptide cyclotransferase